MRAQRGLVLALCWRIDSGSGCLQQRLTLQPQGDMQQAVHALCGLLSYLCHWVPTQQCHQSHEVPKPLESQWKLVRKKKKNTISITGTFYALELLRSNSTSIPYSGKCKSHIQPLDLSFFLMKKFIFFKILFIYLRESEKEHGGVGGRRRARFPTEQGAQCGTRSQDHGIRTWAESRHLTDWATQVPLALGSL